MGRLPAGAPCNTDEPTVFTVKGALSKRKWLGLNGLLRPKSACAIPTFRTFPKVDLPLSTGGNSYSSPNVIRAEIETNGKS